MPGMFDIPDVPDSAAAMPNAQAHRQAPDVLALGARPEGSVLEGWRLRIPVRREEVTVRRHTVVGEEVLVQKLARLDVERVNASVRRETLDIHTTGSLHTEDTQRLDRR